MSMWFHRHRAEYPERWGQMARKLKDEVGMCEACWVRDGPGGRRLSVDHVDGNPRNNRRANLLVLCSRCHILKQHTGGLGKTEVIERLRARLEQERAQKKLPL